MTTIRNRSSASTGMNPPWPQMRRAFCGGPALSTLSSVESWESMTFPQRWSAEERGIISIYFREATPNPHRMSDDPQQCGEPAPEDEIAAAYRSHYEVLEYVITRRFHIPEDDAAGLIHDVFLAFIRNRPRIRNERSWLVGATFVQCRAYWRTRGRDEMLVGLDDEIETADVAEDVANRVAVSRVLRELSTRCRQLLHLRFFEEYSSAEIARQFDTTVDYARKLVHDCVSNARTYFRKIRGRA